MQLNGMRKLLRLPALTGGLTLFLVLISTAYQCGVQYRRDHLMPCIYEIFEVPQKQISHGFPVFWLTIVEGIKQIGCGPVVGSFSTRSFIWEGFLANIIFYALCCSLIVFLMNSRRRGAPQAIKPETRNVVLR